MRPAASRASSACPSCACAIAQYISSSPPSKGASRNVATASSYYTIHVTRDFLVRLGVGEAGLKDMLTSDQFRIEGSKVEVMGLLGLIKTPDGQFPIVTP